MMCENSEDKIECPPFWKLDLVQEKKIVKYETAAPKCLAAAQTFCKMLKKSGHTRWQKVAKQIENT